MSPLTRKPSKTRLLELNAIHSQAEQAALRAEVSNLKEALQRNHTTYSTLRDDVERFKIAVRMQQSELRALTQEVVSVRRELAALTTLTRPQIAGVRAEIELVKDQVGQMRK